MLSKINWDSSKEESFLNKESKIQDKVQELIEVNFLLFILFYTKLCRSKVKLGLVVELINLILSMNNIQLP